MLSQGLAQKLSYKPGEFRAIAGKTRLRRAKYGKALLVVRPTFERAAVAWFLFDPVLLCSVAGGFDGLIYALVVPSRGLEEEF